MGFEASIIVSLCVCVCVCVLQEGKQLLEGEELEKTRAQTAAAAVSPKSPTTPTGRVKRSTTIAKTTEVR